MSNPYPLNYKTLADLGILANAVRNAVSELNTAVKEANAVGIRTTAQFVGQEVVIKSIKLVTNL